MCSMNLVFDTPSDQAGRQSDVSPRDMMTATNLARSILGEGGFAATAAVSQATVTICSKNCLESAVRSFTTDQFRQRT